MRWEKLKELMNDIEACEDDVLFDAWIEIGGFIVDQARDGCMPDELRIKLTNEAEGVLEALSAAAPRVSSWLPDYSEGEKDDD